jgi:hypothetical protein
MRSLAVIGVLWLLAASSTAVAQIQVTAQTQRSNFLLYERVDLLVTIQNDGGADLVLDNAPSHPWLSFLVAKHSQNNYVPVRQERNSSFKSITVKSGESKTLRINLTPLFTFREEGDYQAAAVLDVPSLGQIISDNVLFSVMHGQKVWSQMKPVDDGERVYSLIRFSPDPNSTELYLRVEDPAHNLVYANLGLGKVVSFIDPDVLFDPQGNLHVMQPIAMGTYLYSRTDPDGKVMHQGIFKSAPARTVTGIANIPPRLQKLEDGSVTVLGGLEDNPNTPRETLSKGQIAKGPEPVKQGDASTFGMGDAPSAAPAPIVQQGANQ